MLGVTARVTRALPQRSERGAGRAAPRTDGTAGRAVAAWNRSKRWSRRLRSTGQGPPDAFDFRLTNGRVEAVTSLIQAAKVRARGYGTTRHLITILYLVAGKLTRLPTSPFVVKSGLSITT